MSIDPGLGGTGWALWEKDKLLQSGSVTSKEGNWINRAQKIVSYIIHDDKFLSVRRVYCELPFIHQDGGRASISAAKQDVIKLTMLVGMLAYPFSSFRLVRVLDWKGQLPKELVKERVVRALAGHKLATKTTHEIDAIGIGMFIRSKPDYYLEDV